MKLKLTSYIMATTPKKTVTQNEMTTKDKTISIHKYLSLSKFKKKLNICHLNALTIKIN